MQKELRHLWESLTPTVSIVRFVFSLSHKVITMRSENINKQHISFVKNISFICFSAESIKGLKICNTQLF